MKTTQQRKSMAQRKASKKSSKHETPTKRQGKLSLHPVEFEDALAAFLNIPAPSKPAKTKAKPQAKKR